MALLKVTVFLAGTLAIALPGAIIAKAFAFTATATPTSTQLLRTGDWAIVNGTTAKLPTRYQQKLAQDDARGVETRTQRIQFPRGAVGTVVRDSVVRGERTIYLLRAQRGQIMRLSLTSLEQNAVFDVQAPNGQYLQEETTSFRGELPQTGDYSVIVSGTRGNASYRLEVTIR